MKKYILMLLILTTMTSSLNLSYADSSVQTIQNTPPVQNYLSCILTKWAFEYHGKIPMNILLKYFTDMNSACNRSTSVTTGEEENMNTTVEENNTNTTVEEYARYPGCDTDDITLANGQVWSSCNVGANKSYSGISMNGSFSPAIIKDNVGHYFQWGQMIGWASNTGTLTSSGIKYPSGETINTYPSTFKNENFWDTISVNQGPCSNGYHVPSRTEWENAYSSVGIGNQNKFNNTLKLVAEFDLASNTAFSTHEGGYWSTTSEKNNDWAYGQMVSQSPIMYGNAYSDFQGVKSNPALIRCIKN
ncbi:hypothetical protein KBD33_05140 [Candidatus Gracilibacteria bacterium]|nr:hypothetical protein [Candidatus Gracilibacteria bacterium]